MQKRFFLLLITSVLFISCSKTQREVPFKGPKEIVGDDTVYYHIPDFEFRNQDSVVITNDSYKGKVYAINFFFTSCPTQCPTITSNLLALHEEFKGNDQVKLVSVTLDPEFDTEEKLRIYAKEGFGIDTKYWDFLRADENYTFRIMNGGFFQSGAQGKDEQGDIGHSSNIVLIDQEGRLRIYYDALKKEDLEELSEDIKTLLK